MHSTWDQFVFSDGNVIKVDEQAYIMAVLRPDQIEVIAEAVVRRLGKGSDPHDME